MNKGKKLKKYGRWALITGASSGIGAEFAQQLAAVGFDLVIVARREEPLDKMAASLAQRYSVTAKCVVVDLTKEEGIQTVIDETRNLEVGLLVNNAGREDSGYFLQTPVEDSINTLDLNIKAPLMLTHHFARLMVNRKKGGIIFMSSIVAFQGVPLISNYTATKAYNLILGESLAAEFKPKGIDVLAVAPGFTDTNLSPDFNFKGLPFKPMKPEHVVKTVLKTLGNKRLSIPGFINKFLYYSGKIQPRSLNTLSFAMVFKKVLRDKV